MRIMTIPAVLHPGADVRGNFLHVRFVVTVVTERRAAPHEQVRFRCLVRIVATQAFA